MFATILDARKSTESIVSSKCAFEITHMESFREQLVDRSKINLGPLASTTSNTLIVQCHKL